MEDIEINVHTPAINTAMLSHIKWDERGAAALYKMLMQLGATKDIRLFITPSTHTAYVMVKFYYGEDPITNEPLYGDQRYELEGYINKLIKGHRIKMAQVRHTKGMLTKIQNTLREYSRKVA